jgi:hypothetical protein
MIQFPGTTETKPSESTQASKDIISLAQHNYSCKAEHSVKFPQGRIKKQSCYPPPPPPPRTPPEPPYISMEGWSHTSATAPLTS